MATINNIFNIKISCVDHAGSVNFGNTININPESNIKSLGGSFQHGDLNRMLAASNNNAVDPDVIDQP
jgi:hypothetical protein